MKSETAAAPRRTSARRRGRQSEAWRRTGLFLPSHALARLHQAASVVGLQTISRRLHVGQRVVGRIVRGTIYSCYSTARSPSADALAARSVGSTIGSRPCGAAFPFRGTVEPCRRAIQAPSPRSISGRASSCASNRTMRSLRRSTGTTGIAACRSTARWFRIAGRIYRVRDRIEQIHRREDRKDEVVEDPCADPGQRLLPVALQLPPHVLPSQHLCLVARSLARARFSRCGTESSAAA